MGYNWIFFCEDKMDRDPFIIAIHVLFYYFPEATHVTSVLNAFYVLHIFENSFFELAGKLLPYQKVQILN